MKSTILVQDLQVGMTWSGKEVISVDAKPESQIEDLTKRESGLTQHALDAATVAPKCTTEKLCPVHNVWHAAPPRK